jgi:flavin reductase (DIM6/NTAB) family NADH-FMN oxidoreductase RutF
LTGPGVGTGSDLRSFDPALLEPRRRNALLNGMVGPRPVAWISSLDPDGVPNLAPFSFFNAFSYDPPTIAIGPGSRQGVNKDTLRNLKAGGEFVVNLVSRDLAERANACSGEWGPEVDEWKVAEVTPVASSVVAPPRVAEAPGALECRVRQVIELGEPDRATNSLVLAWVVQAHLIDEGLDRDGRVVTAALDLVGRLGGDEWCTTRDRFALSRPDGMTVSRGRPGSTRSGPPASARSPCPRDR